MSILVPDLPQLPTHEIMRILADRKGHGHVRERMLSGLLEMLYPHRWQRLHRRLNQAEDHSGPHRELGISLVLEYWDHPPTANKEAPGGKIELLLTEYGLFEKTNEFVSIGLHPGGRLPFAADYRNYIKLDRQVDPYAPPDQFAKPPNAAGGAGNVGAGDGQSGGGGRGADGSPPGSQDGPDGDGGSGLRDVIAHPILFSDPDRLMAILNSI